MEGENGNGRRASEVEYEKLKRSMGNKLIKESMGIERMHESMEIEGDMRNGRWRGNYM